MTRREQLWVQSIQDGDKRSCHAFVAQYLPSLFAFFRGMGLSPSHAEDLAQETFLEVWKSLGAFRGDSSLKTWIFVIGRRVAWRQIKRSGRDIPVADLGSEESEEEWGEGLDASGQAMPQDELLWKREQKALLEQLIQELAPHAREVLLLHYMEELSLREVAMVLEIAEGTAKSRLNRALAQLRKKLGEQSEGIWS